VKESILAEGDSTSLQVRCLLCQQLEHDSENCPYFHYIADKERIIKKHAFSKPISKRVFQRRRKFENQSFLKNRANLQSK